MCICTYHILFEFTFDNYWLQVCRHRSVMMSQARSDHLVQISHTKRAD